MNHCSNCGERIVEGQQFCRSCGAELVVEGRWRWVSLRSLIFVGLFFTFVSALVVVFGKFADSKTVAFAGTVSALLSFGVMLTGAILSEMPRRRRNTNAGTAHDQNEQPTLEKADTTNRLPPRAADDHFPASVTEQTTTRLRHK